MNDFTQSVEFEKIPREVIREAETLWINDGLRPFAEARGGLPLGAGDIDDAEARLGRFAPFIAERFPETAASGGKIESPLEWAPKMRAVLNEKYGCGLNDGFFLKRDDILPVAGSVKARGGVYEVLKHSENLALQNGLLNSPDDSYAKLAGENARKFFGGYKVQVGSTGNLGLSVGVTSRAFGFKTVVHMSSDAKNWKKDLLRSAGAEVAEYASDYAGAVAEGRRRSAEDEKSYFIDDENSENLFPGYATAGKRLETQLRELGAVIGPGRPLFVYMPCGVGGAPGGISLGLKSVYGGSVHCFFAEPVQSPCMLIGLSSGLRDAVSVRDAGLSGVTAADGLAVARPSGLACRMMAPLLSGIFTVSDANLFRYMRDLYKSEKIFAEPSACAAFAGPAGLFSYESGRRYIARQDMRNAVHVVWLTGGGLTPETVRKEYIES